MGVGNAIADAGTGCIVLLQDTSYGVIGDNHDAPSSKLQPHNVIAVLCGSLLIGAVALKVIGSNGSVSVFPMFSPEVQLAGLQIEAIVGIWLLSGIARKSAAFTGVSLFAVLGAVSLYLGLIGQPSCGCFGRIEVSPWSTLAADVFCAGALSVASFGRRADWQRPLISTLWIYFAGLAAFGVLLAVETSPAAGRQVARLRGESLVVFNGGADAGDAVQGDSRMVSVVIRNVSDHDVRIVGGTSSCACVATDGLPVMIAPGTEATMNVRVRFTGEPSCSTRGGTCVVAAGAPQGTLCGCSFTSLEDATGAIKGCLASCKGLTPAQD